MTVIYNKMLRRTWRVIRHDEGENQTETLVYMAPSDDSLEDDKLVITMNNEEAHCFPVNNLVTMDII